MSNCKIRLSLTKFKVEDDLEWPPYEVETIWAEHIANGRAKVLNTPFFAKGISLFDEVAIGKAATKMHDRHGGGCVDVFDFVDVLSRSGHGTLRVLFLDDALRDVGEAAVLSVCALGCSWESGKEVLAIDIPPSIPIASVLHELSDAVKRGAIFVDVGFLPD